MSISKVFYSVKPKRRKAGKRNPTKRFGAKLLFEYRVVIGKSPGKRRVCEERIVNFACCDGNEALREALKRGRAAQHSYENSEGNRVHLLFVGVMELICLDLVCAADEVWYEMPERLRPMERKAKLIPRKSQLHAIRNND